MKTHLTGLEPAIIMRLRRLIINIKAYAGRLQAFNICSLKFDHISSLPHTQTSEVPHQLPTKVIFVRTRGRFQIGSGTLPQSGLLRIVNMEARRRARDMLKQQKSPTLNI